MKPTKVYDVKREGPIPTEIPNGDPPSLLYKICDDAAICDQTIACHMIRSFTTNHTVGN